MESGSSTPHRMKTSHRTLQVVVAVGLVAAGVRLSSHALAGQPAAIPPATSTGKSSPYDLEIADGKLILPAGKVEATLDNVVDALRDHYPEANIVLAPGLAKLIVADLKLRAGSLLDQLEGLRVATDAKFEIQPPNMAGSTIDPTTGIPRQGSKPNTGLFVLRDPPPIGPRERVVEAFNIGPYLRWMHLQRLEGHPKPEAPKDEADDRALADDQALTKLISIIQNTINDFKSNSADVDRPSCQYHPGATLLVVIGNIDSVEIARKIVNALPGMSAVANSAGLRYELSERERERLVGGGYPPEGQASAEEAFRARYGLPRVTPPSSQQGPDDDTPRAAVPNPAAQKANQHPAPGSRK